MEPPPPPPPTDPNLKLCKSLLRLRNFPRCRHYALQIHRSHPQISLAADRILAIADVHLAAANRRNGLLDWYAILQLSPNDSSNHHLIRQHFKKLAHLLNPNKNNDDFANLDEAFVLVRDAWRVLSDHDKKNEYDKLISECLRNEEGFDVVNGNRGKMGNVNVGEKKFTFWTMCPYCWCLHEYDKVYVDCCLRCVKCRRVYQGISVKCPSNEMLVKGKDQYYCYCAHVPLRYPPSQENRVCVEKEKEKPPWCMEGWIDNGKIPVEIDGDGDDEDDVVEVEGLKKKCGVGVGEGGLGSEKGEGGELNGGLANGKRRMRVKTVAWNTRKMTGNRMRNRVHVHVPHDSDDESLDLDGEDG